MFSEECELTPYGEMLFQSDPQCEFCGCSVIGRFGGITNVECDSCKDTFHRYSDAHGGMIEIDDVESFVDN